MVQFGAKLKENLVEKWADSYVDYARLQKHLYKRYKAWEAGVLAEVKAKHGIRSSLTGAITSISTPLMGHIHRLSSNTEKTALLEGSVNIPTSSAYGPDFNFKSLVMAELDKVDILYTKTVANAGKEMELLLRTPHDKVSSMNNIMIDNSYHKNLMNSPTPASNEEYPEDIECCKSYLTCGGLLNKCLPGLASVSTPPQSRRGSMGSMHSLRHSCASSLHLLMDVKELESLQRAMCEIYRDLTLLKNFSILNYTAVVKIVKKHDKVLGSKRKKSAKPSLEEDALFEASPPSQPIGDAVLRHVHKQDYYRCEKLDALIDLLEEQFALYFCGGNIQQARGMLLPLKQDEFIDWGHFQLGYHLGLAAVLALWVIWDCGVEVYRKGQEYSLFGQPAFIVYRAVAGLLLLHWAWAISTLVWQRTRINYIFLFDLDPRWQSPPMDIFNEAAIETVVFFLNMLIYYKVQIGAIPDFFPAGYIPLALVIYAIKKMTFPLSGRREIWLVLAKVFFSPMTKVTFFSTYVADVLTSSVKTSLDLAWTVGYFASGDFLLTTRAWRDRDMRLSWEQRFWYNQVLVPALCILPLWLRFQQCLRRYHDTGKRFPNLANALKYGMAQCVSIFAVFRPSTNLTADFQRYAWIVLYIVSSLYSFSWDVFQDWGLGDRSHLWLSERRMHSRVWIYYAAIVVDLVLRFNWLYSFVPPGSASWLSLPMVVTTLVITLEICRRTMWGFLRLEHEHLRNTEGYRSIDVVPLHFSTAKQDRRPKQAQGVNVYLIMGEVVLVGIGAVLITILVVVLAKTTPT